MKKRILSAITMTISLLVPLFPETQTVFAEEPKLQIGVMSDVHVRSTDIRDAERFKKALTQLKTVAPDYDVIAVNGDMTEHGFEAEYDIFNQTLDKYKSPNAEEFMVVGNHEYFETYVNPKSRITDRQMQERFIKKMEVPNIYYDKWIDGYHFITLAGEKSKRTLMNTSISRHGTDGAYISDTQFNWFKKTIAEKAERNKPIFVFLHQPISNTVYGSRWNAGFREKEIQKVLEQYPQAILFTGHSHYPLYHPDSIVQNKFTYVNTGSVSYGYEDKTGSQPNVSEGYLVNVYKDRVEFQARDFTNNKWIKTKVIQLSFGKWEQKNKKWYYYDQNGKMKTGWVLYYGKWYYLDKSGVMKTSWIKDKNHWYYLDHTGAMKTGWVKDKNKWYYLQSSGEMQTGWVFDNKWYYLDNNGVMKTGWVKDKNKWYYLENSGAMKTGWVKDNNTWYYLDKSGAMKTGWLKENNKWYYLKSNGAMVTNWNKIGGKRYYFYSNGALRA